MMRHANMIAVLMGGIGFVCGLGVPVAAAPPTPEQLDRIGKALPERATARPRKAHRLLVFTLTRGFRHSSIECGAKALEMTGRKTSAFYSVISDDIAMFEPESLRGFDAVCFMNTTGELFMPANVEELPPAERAKVEQRDARLKRSLVEFVRKGGGIIGIHAATDCLYRWPMFGEMMGGYFNGHPWHESVTIKIDDPDHPVTSAFGGRPFEIVDEIYQFRDPYSRDRLRVLLSLDTGRTDMEKDGIRRNDGDFAVSWIRRFGRGRVFYCSLGHREEIFWNPTVLRHYLDGIQFVLRDLPGDATPSAKLSEAAGWTPLLVGEDLAGWKGLVGNPVTRAAMSAEELAGKQASADEKMRAHWKVEGGVLVFDGKGDSICTAKEYGDFEMLVDWKIEAGGDSGIYLRGSPQVQIWDPVRWPEGSGGLYNNRHNPGKPRVRADHPIGQWNTFRIKMIGERVTVHLNDVLVVDDVVLESYWQRDKPIYPKGQIELQSHDGRLYFKNILIREIPPAEAATARSRPTWGELFNGRDLTGWTCKPGSWIAESGELVRKGGGDIWTERQFGDFVLELEFKLDKGTNSGIFFRTGDIRDCVQTGIELQVLDSHGNEPPGKHDCGAVYDCLAPSVNAVRQVGAWNHVVLTCRGSRIQAAMNGLPIIDMNLDRWTEAHKNPDGTRNKFRTPYKEMPRVGHIGFQDHGKPIWYRNIRIKPLAD